MCAATDKRGPRTRASKRPFLVVDGMLLVAAMAVGSGLLMAIGRAERESPCDWCLELFGPRYWYDLRDYCTKVLVFCLLATPLAAMVSLAQIAIRLVGQQPCLRRLARQPGLIASCASSIAIVFIGLPVIVGALAAGARWDETWRRLAKADEVWSATKYGGLAVFVSWMTLVVTGGSRAERSWVDRLGRFLGVYWIVAAIALRVASFYTHDTDCVWWFRSSSPTWASAVGYGVLRLAGVSLPLIASLSLVLIPVRLVGTRTPFRRLAREPGLVASLASVLAIALFGLRVAMILGDAAFAGEGVTWKDISSIPAWLLDDDRVALITMSCGLSVLASWVTLGLGRQWRATSTWSDRLGRAAGFFWIMAGFAVATGEVLMLTDSSLHRSPYLTNISSTFRQ